MQTQLPIETVVLFLKELPKGREYETEAIKVARKTHQIVWQNIIFALRVIKK